MSVLYDVVTLLENGRPSVLLALEDARQMLLQANKPVVARSAASQTTDACASAGAAAFERQSANAAPSAITLPAGGSSGSTAAAAAAVVPDTIPKLERLRLAAAERKLWFFSVWFNQLAREQYMGMVEAIAVEWRVLHETVVVGASGPPGLRSGNELSGPNGAWRPGAAVRVKL